MTSSVSPAIDEVGGVPFEILEPVLERCTPEQLYRIEECNQVTLTVTHTQGDTRSHTETHREPIYTEQLNISQTHLGLDIEQNDT